MMAAAANAVAAILARKRRRMSELFIVVGLKAKAGKENELRRDFDCGMDRSRSQQISSLQGGERSGTSICRRQAGDGDPVSPRRATRWLVVRLSLGR
jgi:hypothetical protein